MPDNEQDSFEDRLQRISTSLARINTLMQDLKHLPADKKNDDFGS